MTDDRELKLLWNVVLQVWWLRDAWLHSNPEDVHPHFGNLEEREKMALFRRLAELLDSNGKYAKRLHRIANKRRQELERAYQERMKSAHERR